MVLKNSKLSKKGFTIVELLVVIVVIGILAAITVVSYSGVTNKANASANKSNAKSVISAAESVKAENSDYPTGVSTPLSMTNNLNASVAKVPSNITVTGQSSGQAAQSPAVIMPNATNGAILYVTKTDGSGICAYYYDNAATTPGVYAITSGSGTAVARPGTALAATCL